MLAPQQSPLLEIVRALAPSVAGGNTAVVVASKVRRWLAEHADGDGIDLNSPSQPAVPQSDDRPRTIRLIADR